MFDIASTILTVAFALASTISFFYILYRLVQEKGILHGVLGFLFPIYPFIWGWLRGSSHGFLDIMIFWTFMTIGSVAFPVAMAAVSGPSIVSALPVSPAGGVSDLGPSVFSDDVVRRGSISPGSQVLGDLQDLFAIDEWTFSGSSGQVVTIRCQPAPGSGTDPRVALIGPGGEELISDDDGGGDLAALIEGYSLPSTGTYSIHVDVWSAGPYVLTLE